MKVKLDVASLSRRLMGVIPNNLHSPVPPPYSQLLNPSLVLIFGFLGPVYVFIKETFLV